MDIERFGNNGKVGLFVDGDNTPLCYYDDCEDRFYFPQDALTEGEALEVSAFISYISDKKEQTS